jgi:hypothetical protein
VSIGRARVTIPRGDLREGSRSPPSRSRRPADPRCAVGGRTSPSGRSPLGTRHKMGVPGRKPFSGDLGARSRLSWREQNRSVWGLSRPPRAGLAVASQRSVLADDLLQAVCRWRLPVAAAKRIPRELALNMSNPFFDRPILNSPNAAPTRRWELDNQGQPTQQIIESRRRAAFISPIPKPRKARRNRKRPFRARADKAPQCFERACPIQFRGGRGWKGCVTRPRCSSRA